MHIMQIVIREPKKFLLKAILVSALFHTLIFFLFNFKLSARQPAFAPKIFFLGGMLGENDIVRPIRPEGFTAATTPIPLVSRRISSGKLDPRRLTAVPKPAVFPADGKTFQKSLFALTPESRPPEKTTIEPAAMRIDTPGLRGPENIFQHRQP